MKTSKQIILILLVVAVLTAAIWFYCPNSHTVLPDEQNLIYNNGFQIQEKQYIQLLFVGDLMFDREVRLHAQKGGSNEFIFEKITPVLLENDLVVANLEGPITDAKSMSITAGPTQPESITFTFDPSLAKTLYNQNIRLVDLGNNHILNFGKSGVDITEKYLTEAKVDYFGVPEKKESIIKEIGGIKIAFVSYNYYEFRGDLAKAKKATNDEIIKVKPLSDIVVVFCHWGEEYKFKNNAEQKDLAYKFIDAGADLIIGSHPHVIQNVEEYNGKKIYYSLGNFIFDQDFNEDVKKGLGVVVRIDKTTKNLEFVEKHFYTESNGQAIEEAE